MKLRFRENSLRLRVNRREVDALASGERIQQRVAFPGNTCLTYILEPDALDEPEATFRQQVIRIRAPVEALENWAKTDAIGLYFELPTGGAMLKVAIEKDLECVDAPLEERDLDAFSRPAKSC